MERVPCGMQGVCTFILAIMGLHVSNNGLPIKTGSWGLISVQRVPSEEISTCRPMPLQPNLQKSLPKAKS